jgi:hypothetical protein
MRPRAQPAIYRRGAPGFREATKKSPGAFRDLEEADYREASGRA